MSRPSEVPVVGLSTYREAAAWGVWHQRADVLHREYADAVVAVGGAPVLLPPASGDAGVAAAVVDRLDALVVTGGADVDPARYGQDPHPRTTAWRPERDAWELALLDAAEAAGLPVLGVCRGMQLMAVRAGGALDQHTPEVVGHDDHSPGADAFGTVTVDLTPGSRVHALLGERVEVACHHHQSVREAPGFVVGARAGDGIVEAIEQPGDRFCVAVQWHPEMRTELALLSGLLAAVRRRGGG
jgi:putative glutamine amidotransferase